MPTSLSAKVQILVDSYKESMGLSNANAENLVISIFRQILWRTIMSFVGILTVLLLSYFLSIPITISSVYNYLINNSFFFNLIIIFLPSRLLILILGFGIVEFFILIWKIFHKNFNNKSTENYNIVTDIIFTLTKFLYIRLEKRDLICSNFLNSLLFQDRFIKILKKIEKPQYFYSQNLKFIRQIQKF